MIIEDLTNDYIQYVIEHLHAYCACREDCKDCHYADDHVDCVLFNIPAKWRPEAIKERGEQNDQGE